MYQLQADRKTGRHDENKKKLLYLYKKMSDEEVVKFYYFSESGACGSESTADHHQRYCNEMLKDGYTLVSITQLGNLDDRRDSYEGTLIYQWKKKQQSVKVDRGDKIDA